MTTLDFTTGMPGGVTVTSSPAGYAKTSSGTLTSFSANAGRRTDLGIVVEPAATNLKIYSQDVSQGATYFTHTNVTTNVATAPDGTTTADKFAIQTGFTDPYPAYNVAVTGGVNYCFSVYAKNDGLNDIFLDIEDTGFSGGTGSDNLNLTTGAFNTTGGSYGSGFTYVNQGVEALGSGWFRVWTTFQKTTSGNVYLAATASSSGGTVNGTNGINVWQLQLESGVTAPSTSITTSGSTATRAADAITFTIPGGVTSITYTFDDNSTQVVSVSSGSYTIPTNLNRPQIKTISWSSGSYSLTSTVGALALTGKATGVLFGRKVISTVGAQPLTGKATGALYGRALGVTKGSIALTGKVTGFLYNRVLGVTKAAIALTGIATGLIKVGVGAYVLVVTKGAMALTGITTGALYKRLLGVTKGSLALAAPSVAGLFKRVLTASVGALPLVGKATGLVKSATAYVLAVATGAIALTGKTTGALFGRVLQVATGSLALNSVGVGFLRIGAAIVALGAALLIGL